MLAIFIFKRINKKEQIEKKKKKERNLITLHESCEQ